MRVRPCAPAVGATITDIDLTRLDDEAMSDLWGAFHRYSVLVFRDQHLEPRDHVAFAERWGTALVVPELADHAVPGHAAVLRVTNAGKQAAVTENWHFDSAFFESPPPITMLAAQRIPDLGGDTMWANQYAAYDGLSTAMQRMIDSLCIEFVGSMPDADGHRAVVSNHHRAVQTHPATGRRSLRTGGPDSAPRFHGMRDDESRPLLDFLHRHATRPDFVYRHSWRDGDVVMWDNRCLLHYAIHDYGDAERLLHRVTVINPTDETRGAP